MKATNIKQRIESRLQRIANVLLLNASFTENPGLLNGKMGTAIFFYHYARYFNKKAFEGYAGNLIDEIYEEINQHTPLNFAGGLTGIGWGIEYLVKNGFVKADTDEALGEIDTMVFRGTTQKPVCIEKADLFGFGLYSLARLWGREHNDDNNKVLFLKQMVVYMVDECERLLVNKKFLDIGISYLSAGQLNSIIYCLLEVHRLDLFPVKVNNLLCYLPPYIETAIQKNDNSADLQTLLALTCMVADTIPDPAVKEQFRVATDRLSDRPVSSKDDEMVVNDMITMSWHPLIYAMGSNSNAGLLSEKVFTIVDNEENWDQRLDKLDNNNLGLDKGMAGLGLALLKLAECSQQKFSMCQSADMPMTINDSEA